MCVCGEGGGGGEVEEEEEEEQEHEIISFHHSTIHPQHIMGCNVLGLLY